MKNKRMALVASVLACALVVALAVIIVLDMRGGGDSSSSSGSNAASEQNDNGPPPNFLLGIVDTEGDAIGDATIRLAASGSENTITLGSDDDGRVEAVVPEGAYLLSAVQHGYRPALVSVNVTAEGIILLDNAFRPLPEQGQVVLVHETEPVTRDAQGTYVLRAGISSEAEATALLRVHGIIERNSQVVCEYDASYSFEGRGFEAARAGTTLVFNEVQRLVPQAGYVCVFVEGTPQAGEPVFVEEKCGNVVRKGDEPPAPKPTPTPTPTSTPRPGKNPDPTSTKEPEEPGASPTRTATRTPTDIPPGASATPKNTSTNTPPGPQPTSTNTPRPTAIPTNPPSQPTEPPCSCCGCDPGPYPEPTAIPTDPVVIINPTPEPTRPPTPTLPPEPTRPNEDDLPTPLPR